MFYNDFGDFLNSPPSFGSNSIFQKSCLFSFGLSGSFGTPKRARSESTVQNIRGERNGLKLKTRGPTSWEIEGPTRPLYWPHGTTPFRPRGSDAVDLRPPGSLVT